MSETLVSIPFREDLHSDHNVRTPELRNLHASFHPFQGRPSFGPVRTALMQPVRALTFPSLSGKTFIRTQAGTQLICGDFPKCFHPFQGRPPFGLMEKIGYCLPDKWWFPFLSGKSSIRTPSSFCVRVSVPMFPSLSGKSSIRTR